MSEQAPNNPSYLERHPGAVQDIDEAHEIALAGDEDRTEAAATRVGLRIAAEQLARGESPREALMQKLDSDNKFDQKVGAQAIFWAMSETERRPRGQADGEDHQQTELPESRFISDTVIPMKLGDIREHDRSASVKEAKKAEEIKYRPKNISKQILQGLDEL